MYPAHDGFYACKVTNYFILPVIGEGSIMDPMNRTTRAGEIMLEFARITGLDSVDTAPKRYLWTDAFAVCNFLGLYEVTREEKWLALAFRLVDQVHDTLGRHRKDDSRNGWISGLPEKEGRLHPIMSGLRIGKPLNERKPGEPFDERLEWDRDGQYFHYLSKWMHALNRVGRVSGEKKYPVWAVELARAAYRGFTYPLPGGGRRMYWKMSIDLTRPLVSSMGQHDPPDGFITFCELQLTSSNVFGYSSELSLENEIKGLAQICRNTHFATDDPLGLGGLLSDSFRLAQLMMPDSRGYGRLLDSLLNATGPGVRKFKNDNTMILPPDYRLAFRELGLAIGLRAMVPLAGLIAANPEKLDLYGLRYPRIKNLSEFIPVADTLEDFWLSPKNQEAGTWMDHREINMVMLATSLAPEGFLAV